MMKIKLRYVWVGLISFLLTFIPVLTLAQNATPFYWDSIDVEINVQENGDMLVTETQTYVFTDSHTNKRYRYIPLNRVDAIEDISVFEGEEELPIEVGIRNGQKWIQWQHELNAPESHTFTLNYRVVGGLPIKDDGDRVYWKAIFADRSAPIENATVTVRLPESLAGNITSYQSFGVPADAQQIDPRTIEFVSREAIPPQGEIEVNVVFPHQALNIQTPNCNYHFGKARIRTTSTDNPNLQNYRLFTGKQPSPRTGDPI